MVEVRGARLARTTDRSFFNTPFRQAKTQPDVCSADLGVLGGIMERNFLGSEGRVGVIMAYREWGGCCRNPGGVPSAGLRRDKILGLYRLVELKRREIGRSVWGAARTNHRSELLAPPSAKQKPSQTAGLLLGGRGWIRTTEVVDNRFTVCSLWPLGNPSVCAPPPRGAGEDVCPVLHP